MNRIVTTRFFHGIFWMQVCAERDASDEEILAHCNRDNPSGTTCGWTHVIREDSEGKRGPVACVEDPSRLHLLVEC